MGNLFGTVTFWSQSNTGAIFFLSFKLDSQPISKLTPTHPRKECTKHLISRALELGDQNEHISPLEPFRCSCGHWTTAGLAEPLDYILGFTLRNCWTINSSSGYYKHSQMIQCVVRRINCPILTFWIGGLVANWEHLQWMDLWQPLARHSSSSCSTFNPHLSKSLISRLLFCIIYWDPAN